MQQKYVNWIVHTEKQTPVFCYTVLMQIILEFLVCKVIVVVIIMAVYFSNVISSSIFVTCSSLNKTRYINMALRQVASGKLAARTTRRKNTGTRKRKLKNANALIWAMSFSLQC